METVPVARIMVLDPKKTHEGGRENCPSRLVQNPEGKWFCIDCGSHVMWKSAKVVLIDGLEG